VNFTKWSQIRDEQIERIGRGEFETGKEQMLAGARSGARVPDVTSAGFAAEAHRQTRAVAASEVAEDDQAFVDSASDWGSGT
jgi:Protein  of unknown function (DUF3018)